MAQKIEYDRLECLGLWRSDEGAQRKEVVVSFGKASLVLSDTNGEILNHWAMTAVYCERPKIMPVIYSPGAGVPETLEIDDPIMIAAIKEMQKTLNAAQRPKRRLRGPIFAALVLGLATIALWYGPDAMRDYATRSLPDLQTQQIGLDIHMQLAKLTGPACTSPEARPALRALETRFDLQSIQIVPGHLPRAIILPAGYATLSQSMLNQAESQDILSGYILEALTIELREPALDHLTEMTGMGIAWALLTKGQIAPHQAREMAVAALAQRDVSPNVETLLIAFEAQEISSAAFGKLHRHTASHPYATQLIADDPYPNGTPSDILADGAWLGLKDICTSDG